jgi:hypothetical protein
VRGPLHRAANHNDPSSLAQEAISDSALGRTALSDRQIGEAQIAIGEDPSSKSFNDTRFRPRPSFEAPGSFPEIGSRSPKIKWWLPTLALASAAGLLFVFLSDPWDLRTRGVERIAGESGRSKAQSLAQTRSVSLAQQSSEPSNNEVANLSVSPAIPLPMDMPAPLGVSVQYANDRDLLVVTSFTKGTTLSPAIPVGESGWSLTAKDIKDAIIRPPSHFIGVIQLSASLLVAPNFKIVKSQPLRFEWIAQKEPGKKLPQETPIDAAIQEEKLPEVKVQRDNEANISQEQPVEGRVQELTPSEAMPRSQTIRQLPPEETAALLKRGKALVLSGDFGAARLVLQRAAEAGSAAAAFALGETYNPITLERLKVHGLASDIATARYWYEKAKELGSPDALRELQTLASKRN